MSGQPNSHYVSRMARTIVSQLFLGLATLILVEIGVRTLAPEIQPTGTDTSLFVGIEDDTRRILAPAAAGSSHGFQFETTEDGFWKYNASPPVGAERILLVGDSVTMGIGVPIDSTVGGLLARSYHIANPSAIGFNTVDYKRIIDELNSKVKSTGSVPVDHVVVLWCLNDIDESSDIQDTRGSSLFRKVATPLRTNYMTYHWLKSLATDRPRAYYENDRRLYSQASQQPEAIERMHQISHALSSMSIAVDIVIVPYEYQLRTGDRIPQEFLRVHLDDSISSIHDPFELFSQYDSKSLYLFGDGIHLSRKGHRLLAEFIESTVLRSHPAPTIPVEHARPE